MFSFLHNPIVTTVTVLSNDLFVFCFHSSYIRGSQVKLRIKSLELATRFLGSEKDLTLLEADATLLGFYKPVKN